MKRALREQSLFLIDVRKKAGESPLEGAVRVARTRRAFEARFAERHDAAGDHDALGRRPGLGVSIRCRSSAATRRLRNVLAQVHRDVTGGKSISDAMQAQASVFGDAYVASVAAGEAAGKLPEVLGRLAQFQRTEIRVRATVRTLLAYPVLLSGVSSLVVIGLVTFVLPKFVDIFASSKCRCP